MPTYVVTAPQGRLSLQHKRRLAADITNAHCVITTAPPFFAQVIFHDIADGDFFVGGRALDRTEHIYVHGHVRAGRDEATKERLVLSLMNTVAQAAEIEPHFVHVYVSEIPAKQIAEFGRILPNPGEEAQWWAELPQELRATFEQPAG